MCGVVGYIGNKVVDKELIDLLKNLEYRGYDSAGVAYIKNNKINVVKSAGKIANLEKLIEGDVDAVCGIAHTRWATHGKPNDVNAHPHLSSNNKWVVVHNGIIENYIELKSELIKNNNIKFVSDTDTEVVSQLLQVNNAEDKILTLINSCKKLKGSYALACVNEDEDKTLYLAKNKSPLYVSTCNGEVFVASDPICFVGKSKEYYSMQDNEYCIVSDKSIVFYDNNYKEIDKYTIKLTDFEMNYGKKDYEYYMLKEIEEVPVVLKRIVNTYRDNDVFSKFSKDFIERFNNIVLIGCGTAYHAGLMGNKFIEKYARLKCSTYIASEFRYSNPIIDKNTLCIFISQSGETADTLACVELAKSKGALTIALTNVLYSTIAKNVDIVLPVCAGPEIAVASTKAYSAMITILYMLSRYLENVLYKSNIDYTTQIVNLSQNYPNVNKYNCEDLVDELSLVSQAFFIGRNLDYITAEEGSLKLKEITYINSSAYPSGELKHGFLALIENGTHLFVLATEKELLDKTLNGSNEACSRGAKIILVTQFDLPKEKLAGIYRHIKLPNFDEDIMPIVAISLFQILSYRVSVKKGLNPDQPRNLAKSVTVE